MTTRLTAIEQSFLHIDTETTSQAIAVFCPLASFPDIEQVRGKIEELKRRFPRMTQVLAPNKKYWVEAPAFDDANHLFRASDHTTAAAQLFSERFDFSEPLWKCFILGDPVVATAPAALLFKLHHSFADGLGGLAFFDAFCESVAAPSDTKHEVRTRAAGSAAKIGSSLLKLLTEHVKEPKLFPLLGQNSTKRQFAVTDLPLADLKQIKNAAGVTLNDVVLCIVTGALRRYLSARGLALHDTRAIMPVNLRAVSSRDTLGNDLTAVGIPLPVSLENPAEQLAAINAYVTRLKNSGGFGAYALLSNLIAHLPASLQRSLCERQAKKTHFICTNVPGPATPRTFGGAQVLGIYPIAALLKTQGIAFGFLSYAGNLCCTIASDPNIAPEAEDILQDLHLALADLKNK